MFFICLYIFLARLADVSIGTVRTILMVRGKRKIAALLAFVEVIIWYFVAREALVNVTSLWIPLSYAGGYALGTYLGTFITSNYITSLVGMQIITKNNNDVLINKLRNKGYGVSVLNLKKEKTKDKKDMLFIATKRRNVDEIITLTKKVDKKAFMVINDTKFVQNGLIK